MKNLFVKRDYCPACKSENSVELYQSKFTEPPVSTYLNDFYNRQGEIELNYLENESYILDECLTCGLVYQRVILGDFLMSKLYEEWIDPQIALRNTNKNIDQRFLKDSKEVEMIIDYFASPPSDLLLFDFGSGFGHWCNNASLHGCNVVGTELSQTRIDYATKLGVTMISWDDIPNYRFDYINTEQVFEHIPEPLETLQYLSRGLKVGGLIKISVPNGGNIKKTLSIMDWNISKRSKNSLNPVAPLEHINCFSERSITNMAKKIRLEPVTLEHTKTYSILDSTLKDILRPFYHIVNGTKSAKKYGSTYQFFKKV